MKNRILNSIYEEAYIKGMLGERSKNIILVLNERFNISVEEAKELMILFSWINDIKNARKAFGLACDSWSFRMFLYDLEKKVDFHPPKNISLEKTFGIIRELKERVSDEEKIKKLLGETTMSD